MVALSLNVTHSRQECLLTVITTSRWRTRIDPEGYRRFVAGKKRAFEDQVDLEMGVKKPK